MRRSEHLGVDITVVEPADNDIDVVMVLHCQRGGAPERASLRPMHAGPGVPLPGLTGELLEIVVRRESGPRRCKSLLAPA